MIGVSLFRCLFFFVWIWMADCGFGLGWGFYWEDMAGGFGIWNMRHLRFGADRNKTIHLQALYRVFKDIAVCS